jgi:hypothetical protein
LGLVTPQKPCPAEPTQREAEAAGNTSDVNLDQQLLIPSPGGDSLLEFPFPNVSLADIPLPNVLLSNVPLPEARPEGSVCKEQSSPRVAMNAVVVAFELGTGSCLVHFLCSNIFISCIDYYMRREVLDRSRFILFIGFVLVLVYFSYLIHSIMGHQACCVFGTPGLYGTFL